MRISHYHVAFVNSERLAAMNRVNITLILSTARVLSSLKPRARSASGFKT